MIVGFIDEHRDELVVEPTCAALQMAPSTYYAAKRREVAPSARTVRDAAMMRVLMALWVANRKVYGAHKLWKAARRAGHDVGRDQVARLMRESWRAQGGRARSALTYARVAPARGRPRSATRIPCSPHQEGNTKSRPHSNTELWQG